MNRVMRRVQPLFAALALAACAGARPESNGAGFRERMQPVRLVVINDNFNDATIWAVFPAQRIRLGTVTGNATSRFQLSPDHISEPVYLQIDMVGGARCETDAQTLDPGDELELRIVRDLFRMPECAGVSGAR